ncbi:hypothetical protein MGYG_01353 [Nannizzia gypsea CBS 118893]|uniref:Uncharacterized protein n=1 Tax=Arthroderma gypseum (strain ATCC MYA-4604 / CBS 118893) TaxID=535722 RepID=E5R0C4_ARTGP|nr:hypothetical protein MGYG_01353 [Nannizzia gypsea CBS 118893]EFQ98320.1 hypothetical protein MGYG_01353 [Nannizzia gypsea CBS 118893]
MNKAKNLRPFEWNLGLKKLSVKARCFAVKYAAGNIESPFTKRCRLTKPILSPMFDYKFKQREKDIIWKSVSLGSPADTPAVGRSLYARMFRSAYYEALKKHGYDEDGRRLVLDAEGNVVGKRKPGLSCTIQVILNSPIKTVKQEDLVMETERLVQELERQQKKPCPAGNGNQRQKPRKTQKPTG